MAAAIRLVPPPPSTAQEATERPAGRSGTYAITHPRNRREIDEVLEEFIRECRADEARFPEEWGAR